LKKKPVIAGIIFVAVFLAVLLYSTLSLTRSRHRVEVCMQFDGRTNCRVASGQTKDLALRAAIQNACALIAGGVTDSQACERSTPLSVKWLDPDN
jgi:hypothetical protein